MQHTGKKILRTINPLSANPTKSSNTLETTNCLSLFDHFVKLALKELRKSDSG